MKPGHITKMAWQILSSENITQLPLRPSLIALRHGWHVYQYEVFAHGAGCTVADVVARFGHDGFTLSAGNGGYAIFYNHGNPARCRWTIAHELAHIFLGHLEADDANSELISHDQQADNLASRLLCPLEVVHFCGVQSPRALQLLTDLSHSASEQRWRALCVFRRELTCMGENISSLKTFLSLPSRDSLERKALSGFIDFITSQNCTDDDDSPEISAPRLHGAFRL